jgi:SAM-dependent methyltransferase
MNEHPDRRRWNDKYCTEPLRGERINPNLMRLAGMLKPGRVLDLAGGFGQNARWLAAHAHGSRVILADISDEVLRRTSGQEARVLADAGWLPFSPAGFDTVLCIRFFDARVKFAELLVTGGTVFFETYTTADAKYRPDFNPAHRLDMRQIPQIFAGLEVLVAAETDDGHRVYVTVLARKPE